MRFMRSGFTSTEIFQVLLVIRLVAAIVTPISDCDETFNYWDPLHYLIHHSGFQTWEYSPEFALRSYTYIWLHSGPALLCNYLGFDKTYAFFATRSVLGLLCCACETFFLVRVNSRFGLFVQQLCFVFLASSPGMFFSSTAFLPSTTCMYAVLFAFASWMNGEFGRALGAGSFAVLLVWPFCALAFVPLGIHALYRKGLIWVLAVAVCCFVMFFIIPSAIDSVLCYKTQVAPIGNLVMYNVFGTDGANLYGTEPWYYYLQNLFLNLNVVSILGLASIMIVLVASRMKYPQVPTSPVTTVEVAGYIIPMLLVFSQFTLMDHKEERFLTMLYPLLCLTAAIAVQRLREIAFWIVDKLSCGSPSTSKVLSALVSGGIIILVCLSVMLSLSRIVAVVVGYSAPIRLFVQLYSDPSISGNVCLGKEWYRFPTTFLTRQDQHVEWIESGFKGLLPLHYGSYPDGMSTTQDGFNDRNTEFRGAYLSQEGCNFIVDFAPRQHKGGNVDLSDWKTKFCFEFQNSELSESPWRSFYVPEVLRIGLSVNVVRDPYCVYEKRKVSATTEE